MVAASMVAWSTPSIVVSLPESVTVKFERMPLPVMPGLAGGDVVARGGADDEVAGQAGADVLDLADDAQAVLGVEVELGDLSPVFLTLKTTLPERRLVGGQVAAVGGGARR